MLPTVASFRAIFFQRRISNTAGAKDQRGTFTTTDIVTYKRALLDQINVSVIRHVGVIDPYGDGVLLADITLHPQGALFIKCIKVLSRDFGGIHPQPADPLGLTVLFDGGKPSCAAGPMV